VANATHRKQVLVLWLERLASLGSSLVAAVRSYMKVNISISTTISIWGDKIAVWCSVVITMSLNFHLGAILRRPRPFPLLIIQQHTKFCTHFLSLRNFVQAENSQGTIGRCRGRRIYCRRWMDEPLPCRERLGFSYILSSGLPLLSVVHSANH
jgi:hypothetical protein